MSICLKLSSKNRRPCRLTRPRVPASFLEQSLALMILQNSCCLEMVTRLGTAVVGGAMMPAPGSWMGWTEFANSCSLGAHCQEFHADRGYKQQILGPTHTVVHSISVHISSGRLANLAFLDALASLDFTLVNKSVRQ